MDQDPTAAALLSRFLRDLPHDFGYEYTAEAANELRRALCLSLILGRSDQLSLLFHNADPDDPAITWTLQNAQGALEGAEYTEAARGSPCGHIFRSGESSYHCKTCAADSTCVLCARCFAESDHEGHSFFISVSPGNSGCCDCGDPEAWVKPVHCSIHQAHTHPSQTLGGKSAQRVGVAEEHAAAIRATVGKALDYTCDVLSCSPEQLRLPKSEHSVLEDERLSRLSPEVYGGPEQEQDKVEYVLVLWNDEKHTVEQVRDQIARACRKAKSYGLAKATEVDAIGRSVVARNTNVVKLLAMARIIEQIKVSVTIRSARDTFREQMCATIIDWLTDIAGCSVGDDNQILRETVCAELFGKWLVGSPKSREAVGQDGIHDHETEEQRWVLHTRAAFYQFGAGQPLDDDDDEDDDDENEDGEDELDDDGTNDIDMDVGAGPPSDVDVTANFDIEQAFIPDLRPILRRARITAEDAMEIEDAAMDVVVIPVGGDANPEMDIDGDDTANEVLEATMAGYPAPPPPSAIDPLRGTTADDATIIAAHESDDMETVPGMSSSRIPTLPPSLIRGGRSKKHARPPKHWLVRPNGWVNTASLPLAENLNEKLRIDFLILYDLRLWKTLRDTLRHLYIRTVISSATYKRLLGIRFAGLYTLLAQLYLIADREPDHSIVNISLQLFTTPSITAEVIERANFLTNLMAILYTFLTTRQVGYPTDILPQATLAFDAGAITNRRMFHFLGDAKYIIQSAPAQAKLRMEPQFLLQFVDLVKLHQGICSNVRAVGEHVEYENDTWLSASLIVKEVNRLAKFVADGYTITDLDDSTAVQEVTHAIRELSYAATINSLGLESARFVSSEMKDLLKFRDVSSEAYKPCVIPDISVINAHMSFHHPLHYMTSWMLQAAKSLPLEKVKSALFTSSTDISLLQPKFAQTRAGVGPFAPFIRPHDWIAAMFDAPLRVCVWLAQMRAGMWVRNGISLRHQMHSYRSTAQRDTTYQRDIFMLQAGLVLADEGTESLGEKFFTQMIYRFELQNWLTGSLALGEGYEESQHIDVIEEFFHLLVILLTEREDLLPNTDHGKPSKTAVQRDIAHALCFKAQSHSDLSNKLTDRVSECESFEDILREMAKYKEPAGLNDTGTFELKPEYIDLIDPYFAFYSRNQREEADSIYRTNRAKRDRIDKALVIPEPPLTPITSGLFRDLANFTRIVPFAKIIHAALRFALNVRQISKASKARYEAVLQLVLHLVLIAGREDALTEAHPFIDMLATPLPVRGDERISIFHILQELSRDEDYAACHPRIRLILQRARQRKPSVFVAQDLDESIQTQSSTPDPGADKEKRKQAALARAAKVMAQMKAQQADFLSKQGIDSDVNVDDIEGDANMTKDEADGAGDMETAREFPADRCILCQEQTNDERLYGCFAFVTPSKVQRQTPLHDDAYVQEVMDTPGSLDRSAEAIRPFGKASKNKVMVTKTTTSGSTTTQEVQTLAEGFTDVESALDDHVVTSCGHMMHYSCFEQYLEATERRQAQQISRLHPERQKQSEYLCPLCKALNNILLPVLWKPRKESYPGVLGDATQPFEQWLNDDARELEGLLHRDDLAESANLSMELPPPINMPPARHDVELREVDREQLARTYVKSHFKSTLSEQVLANGSPRDASLAEELTRAYKLLAGGFEVNGNSTHNSLSDGELSLPISGIVQTIASTIAAVEIQHRGSYSQHSLLTSISEQTLILLRVLCETAASMFAVEMLSDRSFAYKAYIQEMLGLSMTFGLPPNSRTIDSPPSLFLGNTFWTLTTCTYLLGDAWQRHGSNLLQMALVNELVKVVTIYQRTRNHGAGMDDAIRIEGEEVDATFSTFVDMINRMDFEVRNARALNSSGPPPAASSMQFTRVLKRAVDRHALIFLRKATILVHVRSGVDITTAAADLDPDTPELGRLCSILRIKMLPDLISLFVSDNQAGKKLRDTARRHIFADVHVPGGFALPGLDHPAIFELVGLPKNFDVLSEEAVKRRCPTTGKHMTDPVVCLFCGAIFCGQASCCRNDGEEGGASQHMKKCNDPIGLFINIRKCMVLYRHHRHGSFGVAPYLDKHGEPDPTMRRHNQLFLNQKRYDKVLRDVWLSHGITNVISRKLEGDINNGGWETL